MRLDVERNKRIIIVHRTAVLENQGINITRFVVVVENAQRANHVDLQPNLNQYRLLNTFPMVLASSPRESRHFLL